MLATWPGSIGTSVLTSIPSPNSNAIHIGPLQLRAPTD